jgi:hypothetical protein
MYLDPLPSVRITDVRRSGALTPDVTRVAVMLQRDDGAPVSAEVGVVRVRMRSGAVFLQFICGRCSRRAQVLRLSAGHIMCGRCTGLRYWCEGKRAVGRARHRIERLKASRFHGDPVSRRPGRTMERRAELMASLRPTKPPCVVFSWVERLKAARFHRSAISRRPAHCREFSSQPSQRRSEAVVRRHAAFGDEPKRTSSHHSVAIGDELFTS